MSGKCETHEPAGERFAWLMFSREKDGIDYRVTAHRCACGCRGLHLGFWEYQYGTTIPIKASPEAAYLPAGWKIFDTDGKRLATVGE